MGALIAAVILAITFGAGAGVNTWLRVRRLRAQALLRTLALLVGHNAPLLPGLRAAARSDSKLMRRVYQRTIAMLETGEPLSEAVRFACPYVSGEQLGALQAGEAAGTLPTALREAARHATPTPEDSPALPRGAYVLLLLSFSMFIVVSMTTFLMPKYRDIFADFGLPSLPPATENLIVFTNALATGVCPSVLIVAIPLIAGWLATAWLGKHFWPRHPDRVRWLTTRRDALLWRLPLIGRLSQTRALALQAPVLHASVRAGHDLAAAARHAAKVDANWCARRVLLRWAQAIEQGERPLAAANDVGLAPSLRGALNGSPESLEARLACMGPYYRALLAHWERVCVAVASPLLVLGAGLLVGYVLYALYMPTKLLLDSIMAEMY